MRKIIPEESMENKKRRLCFAAGNGDIEVVKQFLAEGLSANCIFEGNGYITTPLKSAIGGNKEDMIKFLIDEGADPDLEIRGAKPYVTCLAISKVPYEKRLSMIEILYTKKPEMAEEIAEYILERISYLEKEGELDETINSEKSQAIIDELTKINQSRLEQEENLKELAEQTRKTLGLDKAQGRRNSSDEKTQCSEEESKSGSSYEEKDPNHKNPASKVRPNQSQSSPVVPMATNGGCIIS